MGYIPSRFKPLFSRLLALNIDKYLTSREFHLTTIELDIDYYWDKNWNAASKKTDNQSIIAELAFGETIGDLANDAIGSNTMQISFMDKILYILKDFSNYSPVKKDFTNVYQSLLRLGCLEIRVNLTKNEIDKIQQGKPIKLSSIDNAKNFQNDFWKIIHPDIKEIAKDRFENGYYSDSVFRSITEVNYRVKKIIKKRTGDELDGVALMRKAFGSKEPIILLIDNIGSSIDRDIQEGFMQLYAGAYQSIRNPSAHENGQIDKDEAVHYLFLISLLMNKLDSAKY